MTPKRSSRPFYVEVVMPVVFKTPYHIGSGDDDFKTDAPMLRLPGGKVFIPGSTIRGALRSHAERESTLLGCTEDGVIGLFGPDRKDRNNHFGSRLRVYDVYPEPQPSNNIVPSAVITEEIRDHVAINPKWGAAESGAKFDMEAALPADCGYKLRLIYEGDSAEDEEYRIFVDSVDFIKQGHLRVGAKSGWGFGRLQWKESQPVSVRTFDRQDPVKLTEFLNMRLDPGTPAGKTLPACSERPKTAANQSLKPWAYLDLALNMHCEGPIIVKAPIPPEPAPLVNPLADASNRSGYGSLGEREADMIFITRSNDRKKYLPGSSIRGILRSQARHICKISPMLKNNKSATESLFGMKKEGNHGRKTLLEVEDGELISENAPYYFDHVAIDRITNAAEDGAKYSTSPLVSPQFRIRMTLRFTEDDLAAVELFGFVLRDLMEGELWAGAGSGRGYGYIKNADIESVSVEIPITMPVSFSGEDGWQEKTVHSGRKQFIKERDVTISSLLPLWSLYEDSLYKHQKGGCK